MAEAKNRPVLVIAYHFFPDAEVGAVRTNKFVTYLKQYGWQPYVLTVKTKYYQRVDLDREQPTCQIFRTMKFPVPRDINMWLKSVFRKMFPKKKAPLAPSKYAFVEPVSDRPRVPLWRRIEYSLNWMPDDKIGWLLPGTLKALQIIHRHKIDLVFSSGPPWSVQLLALMVKILTRRKWVADFRDPWEPLLKDPSATTALSRRIELLMKKAVVHRADIIICTTPQVKKRLETEHGRSAGEKCHVIPNGYDKSDFVALSKKPKGEGEPVCFIHGGPLLRGRDPTPLIDAVASLLVNGSISRHDIRLVFLGAIFIDRLQLEKKVTELDLKEVVLFEEPVKRGEYLKRIMDEDVLILMHGTDIEAAVPAKTFEYLATGNRILALLTTGATRALLDGVPGVWFAAPDDPMAIAKAICEIYKDVKSGRNKSYDRHSLLCRYSRRQLTKQLAELFDQVLVGRKLAVQDAIPIEEKIDG